MNTANVTTRATGDREFTFTQADFRRISKLIYEHAGISLAPSKSDMVYSRLTRRLRINGISSFAEYIELLGQKESSEWNAFVGALTTHLTSFFREQHHFPILADHLGKRAANGTVHLWSCAASTGEEAYSMAITAAERFESLNPPVSILATDVDKGVLEKARTGIYAIEVVKHLPDHILKRYFLWGSGAKGGSVKIRPELQRLIIFQQFNLLAPVWPMKQHYDAIFCRNVMIYFDRATQRKILQKSQRHLKPEGLFFAGHSENLNYAEDLFRSCGNTVYLAHHAHHGKQEHHPAD